MELIKINASEYGLEENKANELIGNLPQIVKERSVLEKQFDAIIKMDIESPETTEAARSLRLLVQKNRTQGIMVWHKTTKDFFLKGGQFVDAIKRKEVAVNERMENDLSQIEKHAEIKEQERITKLQTERENELMKYQNEAMPGLGNMSDEVWNNFLTGAKTNYENRIEAEKKAEEERAEAERIDKLGRERQVKIHYYAQFAGEIQSVITLGNMTKTDFETLIQTLQVKKDEYEKEQDRIKKENERLEKEAEKKRIEQEKERQEYEAKLKAEREERERIEKVEREKNEKLQKQLRERKKAEQRELNLKLAEKKKQEDEEKAAQLAPDKDKLLALSDKIINIPLPQLSNKEAVKILDEVTQLLFKADTYIKDKVKDL